MASRDDDFVETGGEQDEGLEVPATHGPPLLGKQTRIGIVLRIGNNGTVFVLNGNVGGAFLRDKDASLVNLAPLRLGAVAPKKITQFDHGESDAKMENGRNGEGMVGWRGKVSSRTRILVNAVGTMVAIQGLVAP